MRIRPDFSASLYRGAVAFAALADAGGRLPPLRDFPRAVVGRRARRLTGCGGLFRPGRLAAGLAVLSVLVFGGPAQAQTAPGQVTGVSVTAVLGGLQVDWTEVSDADGYKVQWKSGSEDYAASREAAVSGGSTTRHVINSLVSNTDYTIRVIAAKTGAPDGVPSAEVTDTPGKVTPVIYGVLTFGGSTRAPRNTAFTGRIQVLVDFPGIIPRGIDVSDLVVPHGTVYSATSGSRRARYLVDIHDPPMGGNPLEITFRADAIDQGNNEVTYNPTALALGYTTAKPFDLVMTTTATEPVTGNFNVMVTFSENAGFETGETLTAGQWPGDPEVAASRFSINNGSFQGQSGNSGAFTTRRITISPIRKFEGTLTITVPSGTFAPLSTGQASEGGGSSNNRSVFSIQVDTAFSVDAALGTLQVTAAGNVVPLSPTFDPDTNAYQAQVARTVTRVTVDATARHRQALAPVFLDGTDMTLVDADDLTAGHQVDLQVGANTVKVKGTAENGMTKTYTLNILRNARPTGSDRTIAIDEGEDHTFTAADFSFLDEDGDALSSVSIVTLPVPAKGSLTLGSSEVMPGASVTKQRIDAGDLGFAPAAGESGNPYTTFTFKVNDGASDSVSAYTITFNVIPNTPPTTTGPGAVTTTPDTDYVFDADDFNYQDADNDTLSQVKVVTLPGKGALKLGASAVNAGDVIAKARLDAGDFKFSPVAGESGSPYTTFTFKVSDGLAESATAEMTIHVTSNNVAPMAGDGKVTTTPDTDYVFVADDFNYQDPDSDTLSLVKVVTLPGKGALKLGASAVNAGDDIAKARLDAGDFKFSPVAGESGNPYTTFTFKVNDGNAESADAATMTIDVIVDNVPPTSGDAVVAVSSGGEYVFREGDFPFEDEDDGDTLKKVRVITLPDAGVLALKGVGDERNYLMEDQSVTRADILGESLVYIADKGDGGNTAFTFRVSDDTAESDDAVMTIRIVRASVVDSVVDTGPALVPQAPGAPVVTRAAGGEAALEVRWEEPDNTHCAGGCPEITHYDLQYRLGARDHSAGQPESDGQRSDGEVWEEWIDRPRVEARAGTMALIPLPDTARTTTQVRVRAVNAEGTAGEWSEPGEWTPPPPRMAGGRVLKAWLSRFGRTVAGQAIDAVGDRLYASSGRQPGLRSGFAGQVLFASTEPPVSSGSVYSATSEPPVSSGQVYSASTGPPGIPESAYSASSGIPDSLILQERLPPEPRVLYGEDGEANSRGIERRELIGSSFFSYGGIDDGNGAVSVWGRGAVSDFSGQDRYADETVKAEGSVESLMLGTDVTRPGGTVGLLLAHSRGRGEYRADADGEGRLRSVLTGLYPYGNRELGTGLYLWGMAGYGRGEVTLLRKDGDTEMSATADMDLLLAAGGFRGRLMSFAPGGLSLDVVANAMGVRLASEGVAGMLDETNARASRMRVGLEGTWDGIGAGGGWITPVGRIGLLHDSGDAERGFGAEFEASIHWADPGRSIETRIGIHGLLTHESEGIQERGVSGTLSWDPEPGSLRGAEFSLAGSVNGSATGYLDSLLTGSRGGVFAGLTEHDGFGGGGGGDDSERMKAKLGYGFGVFGGSYTGIPEVGVSWGEGGRDWSAGWRLFRNGWDSFEVLLEATHGEGTDNGGSRGEIGFWLRAWW